jgi:hypothetical protein
VPCLNLLFAAVALMINWGIGIAGLLLVVVSPVLPLVFPMVSRKLGAAGFVTGLMIIGSAWAP